MRGEETQLVGAVQGNSDAIYILPGTHSKHIIVKDETALDFKTYMTGEIFSLMSKNSTLTEAVTDASGSANDTNIEGFVAGVRDSGHSTLLNSLFRTRTRFLLDKIAPESNRSYLSGLLIGSEVQELSQAKSEKIFVVSASMGDHYKIAMQTLGLEASVSVMSDEDVAIRGQIQIVSHLI
jgi:2-dehydro-3-deoxygalactonokinase